MCSDLFLLCDEGWISALFSSNENKVNCSLHEMNIHQLSEYQLNTSSSSSSSSSLCFILGLPQMLPQPPVLPEPPVQMEPQAAAHLQAHPIPPATAGYSRHRPKSKRWAAAGPMRQSRNIWTHCTCTVLKPETMKHVKWYVVSLEKSVLILSY